MFSTLGNETNCNQDEKKALSQLLHIFDCLQISWEMAHSHISKTLKLMDHNCLSKYVQKSWRKCILYHIFNHTQLQSFKAHSLYISLESKKASSMTDKYQYIFLIFVSVTNSKSLNSYHSVYFNLVKWYYRAKFSCNFFKIKPAYFVIQNIYL